jgi:carbon storage regulator
MLVLTRKIGEAVQIGPDITVRVMRLDGGTVRLAIEAPPAVRIFRDEVYQQVIQSNQSAFVATAQELRARVERVRAVRSGEEAVGPVGVSGDAPRAIPAESGGFSEKPLVSDPERSKGTMGGEDPMIPTKSTAPMVRAEG